MNAKNAKIYAISIDAETKKQFESCLKEKYVLSAALMPDAHFGYAAPIGAVLVTKDFVVPAWVGFDIGCGVLAMKLSGKDLLKNIEKHKRKIHSLISEIIPLGKGQKNSEGMLTNENQEKFNHLVEEFKKKPHDKQILNLIKTMALTQLGTLGGGNHFIEIDFFESEVWIVIHSGSRGLGHKIASHYMKIASKSMLISDMEKTFPLAIKSKEGIEYLAVQDFCLKFALLSREEMASRVSSVLEKVLKIKIKSELWVNNNHNHVTIEKNLLVHRKGASSAHKGERGVIPANMRDGSILVLGLGNKDFLNSSAHGAGRSMSRSTAKKQFTLEDLEKTMKNITSSVEESIIDEIPMAYKDIHAVMSAQKESVKEVKHLRPLINWKGTETSYLD